MAEKIFKDIIYCTGGIKTVIEIRDKANANELIVACDWFDILKLYTVSKQGDLICYFINAPPMMLKEFKTVWDERTFESFKEF